MSSVNPKRAKKRELMKKLYDRFSKHSQVVMVTLMNVSSSQVQSIRKQLTQRGAELIIGKNTVVKKVINMRTSPLQVDMEDEQYYRGYGAPSTQLTNLLDQIKGKIGLIFTDMPVHELRPIIESNKMQTVAKVGIIAPVDVTVPPGPSGLDPSQISFFHALHITTKIVKGQIDILKEFKACEKGKPVGNSEATLLQKLNIKPFMYGMELYAVYDDGSILSNDVVSLTPDDITNHFLNGVRNIAALSMELGVVTEASVPHMVLNAFKNLAAISLTIGHELKELKNVGTGPATTGKAEKSAPVKAAKVEEKVEEKEDEADFDLGGLF